MSDKQTIQTKGKILTGIVVSVGRVKTIGVDVVHMKRHPLYKKSVKRTVTYAVHCEDPGIAVGDTVRIIEVKPVSKTKHFRVLEKMER